MASPLTIISIDLGRMKNAEHVQLHGNIRSLIENADAEEIGLASSVYNPYRQAINAEQDIVNNSQASEYTQQMKDADTLRNVIFRRCRNKMLVTELEDSSTTAGKAWPKIQMHFATKYPSSIVNLPYQEKTANLVGFVLDARNILSSEEVKAIGIDGDLDDLDSANQRFASLYLAKAEEKASIIAAQSLILRANTDEAWAAVVVNLNFLANNPDTSKASQTALAKECLANINRVILDAKQRLAQRIKTSGANIEEIVLPEGIVLPSLMSTFDKVTLMGTKLTGGDVKMKVVIQPEVGNGSQQILNADEFVKRYGGHYDITKDEESGLQTMVIEKWRIVSDIVTLVEFVA